MNKDEMFRCDSEKIGIKNDVGAQNNNDKGQGLKDREEHIIEGESFILYSSEPEKDIKDKESSANEQWQTSEFDVFADQRNFDERRRMGYQRENSDEKGFKLSQKIKNWKLTGFKKQFVRVVALALVFGLVGGSVFYATNRTLEKSLGTSGVVIKTTGTSAEGDRTLVGGSVAAVVENCMPSVVSITNKSVTEVRTFFGNYEMENKSNGSGVIIGQNEEELLIVTNYHVVAASTELSVVFSFEENQADVKSEKIVSALIKGYDSSKDIAIIAVRLGSLDSDTLEKLRIATIGDSTGLYLGEPVVAIGNALGYGQSVTDGIISAIGRTISLTNSDGSVLTNKYIQTNAAINPGNSGGALLNMNGELVGINSAKVSDSSVEGMGYAIPISDAMPILENIMSSKTRTEVSEIERGYLGISGEDVTTSDSQKYSLPVGVYVTNVTKGSGADKAGIKVGNVITALDGYSISSISELQNRLKYYKFGETVTVKLEVLEGNNYQETEILVTLSSKRSAGIE